MSAPTMAPWLLANLSRFDAVHLHFARDLVLVPAAAAVLAARRKYVAQTHGMVVPNSKKSAKILDSVVVRRALSRADVVYALVETERAELLKVEPKAQVEVLPNGLDFDEPRPQANPAEKTDVLYLARLAPRKRPMDFVQAAKLLAADFPEWTFSLVGPDEGEVEAINRVLAADPALARRVRWEGPLAPDQTAGRMAQAGVYVLPAEREPFGMTIIEAQAVGLPVVMRSDCGIAPGIVNADAGVAYDGGAEELAAALRPLLSSPEARTSLGERAQQYVRSAFGVSSVVDRLERRYRS
ncbi:glycosyltransferase involved in cell wall biosynthesis [Falsarthrobacter nasiphocae]|uniref:D-inositol 3-phosphate glycosyltransferase n=1 Tax=Falsarthrobacter nasiphocae TaxID=189863 RepID=A0AAE3YG89_9MICC|nr:glycosyltransferase involved in cell wall biosynthesis [Falsarthrobacter nasiphocae]